MSNKYHDLIENYSAGGERLSLAIRGLTPADMLQAPIPGKWSTHQVVIHLADAESALADRIRRVIATDNPPLLAWDENRFMANLFYNDQSAEDAVTLVALTRLQVAKILRNLPDSAFARFGQHNEAGQLTLLDLVTKANHHLDHHLKFIQEKREKLGKSMW